MSRDLPLELKEAIEEPLVKPFLAVFIDLPDPVHAWTGLGTITFADADDVSQDWIGTGGIAAIDSVDEATDGSATGIKVTLFTAGAHKADRNPFEALPPDVAKDIQAKVEIANSRFIAHVAEARGLSADAVIGQQAKIYMGEEAVAAGLVDKVITTPPKTK